MSMCVCAYVWWNLHHTNSDEAQVWLVSDIAACCQPQESFCTFRARGGNQTGRYRKLDPILAPDLHHIVSPNIKTHDYETSKTFNNLISSTLKFN